MRIAFIYLASVALLASSSVFGDDDNSFVLIKGGAFHSALPIAIGLYDTNISPFRLQRHPVTNEQFLSFVKGHREWERGSVPHIFADVGYLSHWATPEQLGNATSSNQPVTRVSWFAAAAYCEAQNARLPTWHEWEFVAAASTAEADARGDAEWRQNILNWYAEPANGELRFVGDTAANFYGVKDIHGLIWEWVEDAGSLMMSGDSRASADSDLSKFCGTGALTLEQKENYAVLMRIAMLSSLRASDTTHSMGFRCARSVSSEK